MKLPLEAALPHLLRVKDVISAVDIGYQADLGQADIRNPAGDLPDSVKKRRMP